MELDELKARIEAEALTRRAARDGFALDSVSAFLDSGSAAPRVRRAPVAPPEPLHYRYFAGLHGRELVESCYMVLLRRGPDPAGLEHYLGLLAAGEHKALIVGRFAYFGEGRANRVRVRGLLPRFVVAAASKIRFVGAFVAWIAAFATLHLRERDARARDERLWAAIDGLAEGTEHSSGQVARRIEALLAAMKPRA